jgi:hypothetical protein
MREKTYLGAFVAATALVALAVPAGATPASVKFTFSVPVSVTTSVDRHSYCDNTGPHITFASTLVVGDKWVQLTFQNSTNNPQHSALAYAQASLGLSQTGTDGNPTVYKQPPLGGAGGNPFIYFEQDVSGNNAGTTWYLGRCVQDFGNGYDNPNARFSASGSIAGFVALAAQSTSCSNKGSSLTISGTSGRNAVKGHLILTNSFWGDSMPTPQHIDNTDIVATLGLTLVSPANGSIPKQPPLGGPGGNPIIYAATGTYFAGGNNTSGPMPPNTSYWAYDDPSAAPGTLLGRCNQLT